MNSDEEEKARQEYEAWNKQRLEEEFQALMNSPFDSLRTNYYYRRHNREEAVKLQKMLEDKLGFKDPEGELPEEAWRKSNWCSE